MNKTNKLWLAMLLTVLVAALVAVGLTAAAEGKTPEIVDSGCCGTNLTWTLDSDGVLTISGTGGLGDDAFEDRTDVKSVVILDGVEFIGSDVFAGCSNLKTIAIPTSVDLIVISSFDSCSALSYIFYGGTPAQWDQIKIYSYLENDNEAHAAYAQSVRDYLKSIVQYNTVDWGYCGGEGDGTNLIWTLDDAGVLTISGTGAMADYMSSQIQIPFVFAGDPAPWESCENIKAVVVEEGVTTIGEFAFFANESLKAVILPTGLSVFKTGAFSNCSALQHVFYAGSAEQWQQVTIAGDTLGILGALFQSSLQVATIHYNTVDWGYCGGEGDGTNLVWWFDGNTLTISGTGTMAEKENWNRKTTPWYSHVSSIQTVILEDGVTTIGNCAFSDCMRLTAVTIPESVISIRSSAFSGCVGLTSITIPDSVTSIGSYAFSGCNSLTEIVFPDSVKNLWEGVCASCESLVSITLPKGINHIIDDSFRNCDSLEEITIPGNVWCVDYAAFEGCDALKRVTVESGCTQIGMYAFWNCPSLTDIILPVSVKSIDCVSFPTDHDLYVFYGGSPEDWRGITIWCYVGDGPEFDPYIETARRVLKKHIHYNAAWHTPGEPVRENEVAAACTTAGSYDEVIYCTQCDYAFSRTPVTVDPLNHPNAQMVDAIPSTCQEHGLAAGVYCPDCDTWVSGHEALPFADHSFGGWVVTQQPTTDRTGTETRTCSVCGEIETRSIDKLPQPDNSGNDNNSDDDDGGSFIDTIRDLFQKILDFFKNLFNWMK